MVRYLIEQADAYVHADEDDALRMAAKNGKLDVVRYLIEQADAYVHANTDYALRWAALNGELDVVRYLIEQAGADVHAGVHADTDDALRWAAQYGQLDVVRYLIEQAGANVHADEDDALRSAAWNGKLDVVRYLVEEAGADVHARQDGALRSAAWNGKLDVVRYLIEEADADVHARGDYALREAVEYGKWDVMRYLVEEAGANVDVLTDEQRRRAGLQTPNGKRQRTRNALKPTNYAQKTLTEHTRVSEARRRAYNGPMQFDVPSTGPGTIDGVVVLDRQLASGSYGSVWMGTVMSSSSSTVTRRRRVVVKVQQLAVYRVNGTLKHTDSSSQLETFVREATIHRLVNNSVSAHRALCLSSTIACERGHVTRSMPAFGVLVFDYVSTKTLDDYIVGSFYEPTAVVDMMISLVTDVHALHANGIAHMDLKPANVLVDPLVDVKWDGPLPLDRASGNTRTVLIDLGFACIDERQQVAGKRAFTQIVAELRTRLVSHNYAINSAERTFFDTTLATYDYDDVMSCIVDRGTFMYMNAKLLGTDNFTNARRHDLRALGDILFQLADGRIDTMNDEKVSPSDSMFDLVDAETANLDSASDVRTYILGRLANVGRRMRNVESAMLRQEIATLIRSETIDQPLRTIKHLLRQLQVLRRRLEDADEATTEEEFVLSTTKSTAKTPVATPKPRIRTPPPPSATKPTSAPKRAVKASRDVVKTRTHTDDDDDERVKAALAMFNRETTTTKAPVPQDWLKAARDNRDFRRIVYTAPDRSVQVVAMNLRDRERMAIGWERHVASDQAFVIVDGEGVALRSRRSSKRVRAKRRQLRPDSRFVVDRGVWHDVVGPLRLLTFYRPAVHSETTTTTPSTGVVSRAHDEADDYATHVWVAYEMVWASGRHNMFTEFFQATVDAASLLATAFDDLAAAVQLLQRTTSMPSLFALFSAYRERVVAARATAATVNYDQLVERIQTWARRHELDDGRFAFSAAATTNDDTRTREIVNMATSACLELALEFVRKNYLDGPIERIGGRMAVSNENLIAWTLQIDQTLGGDGSRARANVGTVSTDHLCAGLAATLFT